ncbi:MAG: FUSC family protein [Bacteroidetes bacterium]|jgi:hypothetical protein|nr:FUSC family protein [Bacteroidota bacterium]
MNEKSMPEFSDQESIEQKKRIKQSSLLDAFFIGFLVGIIIFSVIASTSGLLTLIPLYLVYRLLKNRKRTDLKFCIFIGFLVDLKIFANLPKITGMLM